MLKAKNARVGARFLQNTVYTMLGAGERKKCDKMVTKW